MVRLGKDVWWVVSGGQRRGLVGVVGVGKINGAVGRGGVSVLEVERDGKPYSRKWAEVIRPRNEWRVLGRR